MIVTIIGKLEVPQFEVASGRSLVRQYDLMPGKFRAQIKDTTLLYRFTDFNTLPGDRKPVTRAGKVDLDVARAYRTQANDDTWQRVLRLLGDNGAELRLNIFDGSDRLHIYAKPPFEMYGDGTFLVGLDAAAIEAFDKLYKYFSPEEK